MGLSLLGPATTALMVAQGFEFGLRKVAQDFFSSDLIKISLIKIKVKFKLLAISPIEAKLWVPTRTTRLGHSFGQN